MRKSTKIGFSAGVGALLAGVPFIDLLSGSESIFLRIAVPFLAAAIGGGIAGLVWLMVFDFKRVRDGFSRAYKEVISWRLDKTYWRKFWYLLNPSLKALSVFLLTVYIALVLGFSFCFLVIGLTTGHLDKLTEALPQAFAVGSLAVLSCALILTALVVIDALESANAPMRNIICDKKGYDKLSRDLNPYKVYIYWLLYRGLIRGTVFAVKKTPAAFLWGVGTIAVFLRFLKRAFFYIQSRELMTVFTYGAIGTLAGLASGYATIGMLAGFALGKLSWELISVRLLGLNHS